MNKEICSGQLIKLVIRYQFFLKASANNSCKFTGSAFLFNLFPREYDKGHL